MIEYEDFIKKFPTTEDFEKAYPVGKKVTWYDGSKYTIVGYQIDNQFKSKDNFKHLVIVKWWSKHKQRWYYDVESPYVFYATVEMMKDKKKKKS